MLNEIENKISDGNIEVTHGKIQLALRACDQFTLNFELPPLPELERIKKLSIGKGSLEDTLKENQAFWEDVSEYEKQRMLSKWEKFKDSPTYLNRLSTLNNLTNDIPEANKLLERANSIIPSSDWKVLLSQNFVLQKNFPKAKKLLHENSFDKNLQPCLGLAYFMLKENKINEAEKFLAKALDINSKDEETITLAGIIALIQGDYPKAIRLFKDAMGSNLHSPFINVNLSISYWLNGQSSKALNYLRQAVALNPINKNAVLLYSDLLFKENKQKNIISVLETYLKYDQKDIDITDRLARAFYFSNNYKNAIKILEHRMSLRTDTKVLNNIAVVYLKMKDFRKAGQYFSLGIKNYDENNINDYILIANFFGFLEYSRKFKEIVKISEEHIFIQYPIDLLAKQPIASRICISYLFSFYQIKNKEQAVKEAERLLQIDVDSKLRFELLLFITYHYILYGNEEKKNYFCQVAINSLKTENWDKFSKQRLVNNICVSFLEQNEISKVEELLPMLSSLIHINPFFTATLGLYNLRKGNFERGEALYREAIKLTETPLLRSKIKQKLNLELGKFYLHEGKTTQGTSYFKKVLKEKQGLEEFKQQARALLPE